MLQALEMAGTVKSFADGLPLYACFNPYFPDEGDLAAEKQRLEQKLRHSGSLVKGIYLQVDHLSTPFHAASAPYHTMCKLGFQTYNIFQTTEGRLPFRGVQMPPAGS